MTGAATVVLVDDVTEVRTLVRSRLRVSGDFEIVAEGSTGHEAVDLARRFTPDLMLLDVSMPGMDGLEALPRIREVSPQTRVVMCSGLPEQGLRDRCRALGAAGFVEKSSTFESLASDLLDIRERADSPIGLNGLETKEMLRLLVDAVDDYAIFMLDAAGRISTWNAGAERKKGWTADEIIGEHFRVFYPPEKQAERHPEHELELAIRDGRYEEEGWRLRKDGSRFWAHVTITAVRDESGELVGFGKVTRDDTERREAEERVAEANARLRAAAEEQSQFLGMTAHELRSPVGVLGGSARLLRKHWDELEEQERNELLDGMVGSTERLGRLLTDLLTASRIHGTALALEIEETDLAEHLPKIVSDASRSAEPGDVRLGELPPVTVMADPDRLAQMVENLVANALRHGAAPVAVDLEHDDATASIVVRDAGPGVSESLRPRLFERFATEGHGGTGLGLYIVRELARVQGGDAVYRGEDQAFVISLPRAGAS